MRSSCPRVQDMNLILASLLPPTTPSAPVVVLRKQPPPVPNPAEIALKVEIALKALNKEDTVGVELLLRSPKVDPSHFVHKVQYMHFSRSFLSPPSYKFNPLGPNTHARNSLLSQMSRGEIFRLHLVGNVLRQYMSSLSLGYYAWYAFVGPDMFVSADQLWELMRPFTPLADLDTGGSCSGVVDGKRAAEVLQSASLEELSSNDEAAGAAEGDMKSKLALYVSGIVLAGAIITLKLAVSNTQATS